MIAEVVLILEITIAGLAVMVGAAVYVVLSPLDVAREVVIAVIAWPVDIGSEFVLLEGRSHVGRFGRSERNRPLDSSGSK